jgi:hypothetical protein
MQLGESTSPVLVSEVFGQVSTISVILLAFAIKVVMFYQLIKSLRRLFMTVREEDVLERVQGLQDEAWWKSPTRSDLALRSNYSSIDLPF